MSMIYLSEASRLKKYSAAVTGSQAVVKIEVAVSDHGSLGFLLDELSKIEKDQAVRDKAKKLAERQSKASKPLAISAPLKQIPYFEGDE
ncbi:hypothetical protein [Agrobacterium vitis]|uniref:hypothetical protein n=1 Tax=Agrobacterium vitis TaxID=373 RepID=UPI001574FB0E|nr:hypothetical protein G6L01_020935 [Agrobacterium vitis]